MTWLGAGTAMQATWDSGQAWKQEEEERRSTGMGIFFFFAQISASLGSVMGGGEAQERQGD